jgi:hypothetical protein
MSTGPLLAAWLQSILLVTIGSLLPTGSLVMRVVGMLPVSDKLLHFCVYTWLALLALLAIKRRFLAVLAALTMILLGVALAFGQTLAPGRASEVRHIPINGVGVFTGIAIGIRLLSEECNQRSARSGNRVPQ